MESVHYYIGSQRHEDDEEIATAELLFPVSGSTSIVNSKDCEQINMGDLAHSHRELAHLHRELAPPIGHRDLAHRQRDLAAHQRDLAPHQRDLTVHPRDLAPHQQDLAPYPQDLTQPSMSGYTTIQGTHTDYSHKTKPPRKNSAEPPARLSRSLHNCIHAQPFRNGYFPLCTSEITPTSTVGYRLATSSCTYTPSGSSENLPIHPDLQNSQTRLTCSTESNHSTSDVGAGTYPAMYMHNGGSTLEIPHDPNGSPILVQYDAYHDMDIFVHHPLSKSVFTKDHLDRTALICGAVVPNVKLNYQDFCPSLSGLDSGIMACHSTFR